MSYCGRFAPTPSGPLHFGSLVAAVASYLDAKHNGGEWLVRIEDTDFPRCPVGIAENILECLRAYHLVWDDDVLFQSHRSQCYENELEKLRNLGLVYACSCSRKDIQSLSGVEHMVPYPGTCRAGLLQGKEMRALRFRTHAEPVVWLDALRGVQVQNVEGEVGDFILWRTDGCYAYQLAVVVDDAAQGITHVVRGEDLMDNTARQILLQRALNYPTPSYAHVPVVRNDLGKKLSKQTRAQALQGGNDVVADWFRALQFLNQDPPTSMLRQSTSYLKEWAIEHWDLEKILQRPDEEFSSC